MLVKKAKNTNLKKQMDFEMTMLGFYDIKIKQEKEEVLNIEQIQSVFPIICNHIKSIDASYACISMYALKCILKITSQIDKDASQSFYAFVMQPDFLLFLLQKIQADTVHPFFLKNALKIIKLIIVFFPPIIDHLLQCNFKDILFSILPNKYAAKCIISMIEYNEIFKVSLIQSNFYKNIFQMIANLPQMYSDLFSYYENSYMEILLQLQPYIHFDDSDYETFFTFFLRNFAPKTSLQAKAQLSYITFLLQSQDPELMIRFFHHPKKIIEKLLFNFKYPAYGNVRKEVLQYFERIIQTSDQFASYFATPQMATLISEMLIEDKTIVQVSHFLYTICLSSLENCQNIMTEELFSDLNFCFSNELFDTQYSILIIYILLLKYPRNSTFFPFFSDSKLIDPQSLFEFCDIIIQSQLDGKFEVLSLYNLLVDYMPTSNNNEFLNLALRHITTEDFIDLLNECINSGESDFANASKVVLEKIENLIDV
ncbi:hypothetical protein M9Y10_004973 [Tritrichomonas musculus]|uniref:Uncharacterized protein n=1 Tax=Tritrichomonas musculus TaxID=1915356 RepID=A0ABR2JKW6_9EUKA